MLRSLSVVIPAYNEEANVAKCLRSVSEVLKKIKIDSEIILVNDGSRDKTGKIATSMTREIPNLIVVNNSPNKGYGGSLKSGFFKATKEFIVFIPSDNQFDFSEIELLIKKQVEDHADIVSGIRSDRRDPFLRKLNAWLWNSLVRGLFGYLASDIDCGFKLFRRSILSKISLPSNGAMIDTQFLAGARARGYKVSEASVTHLPRTAGNPTGADLKVITKALWELFIFWLQLKQEILVEKGKAVFIWEIAVIAVVLIIASVTRLYKIDQYLTFLGDEGRDVVIVRDMILGRKFTLIGPGTSIGNMYLGPLYYYLMILPLAAFQLSPVGPAVQIAWLGVATVGLLWWWGRQLFGRTSALIISLLYALSPTVITYTRSSWNPNIMPFFALLTMYGVWKVWRYGYWRWLIVSVISFAFVLNSHYLGLLLIPLIVIFSWKAPKKYLLFSFLSFALLMSPMFIFDARHGWNNMAAMKLFFTDRQTTVNFKFYKAIPNLWPIWQQVVSSMLVAKNQVAALIVSVGFFAGLIFVKNKNRDFWFMITWVVVGLVGLGLYKQHIYDHYFGFLYPAVFLGFGFVLDILGSWVWPVSGVLLLINLVASPLRYSPNNQLAHTRQIADFINHEAGNTPFNMALLAKQNYDKSYRYFLNNQYLPMRDEFSGKLQITDQLFVVCEDKTCEPINNPLWEIAAFGWAKIDRQWEFPWGVKLFKLVRNIDGKPL